MYPLLFITSILATKNVPFDFSHLKYFRGKHCELLVNSSVRCVTRGGGRERERKRERERERERETERQRDRERDRERGEVSPAI